MSLERNSARLGDLLFNCDGNSILESGNSPCFSRMARATWLAANINSSEAALISPASSSPSRHRQPPPACLILSRQSGQWGLFSLPSPARPTSPLGLGLALRIAEPKRGSRHLPQAFSGNECGSVCCKSMWPGRSSLMRQSLPCSSGRLPECRRRCGLCDVSGARTHEDDGRSIRLAQRHQCIQHTRGLSCCFPTHLAASTHDSTSSMYLSRSLVRSSRSTSLRSLPGSPYSTSFLSRFSFSNKSPTSCETNCSA